MYDGLIGNHTMLTPETRWLAVTHKTFDQGKRGYNDRLSYLGRRIVEAQTSIALANMKPANLEGMTRDKFGRLPAVFPELRGLQNITENVKETVLNRGAIARIGEKYGLDRCLRWSPQYVSLTGDD
jgi:large subunit ribosomal protein L15